MTTFGFLAPLADHLWQSTIFAAAAAVLALVLRNNQARVRHWIWMAASLKFLGPFSLLISVGSHFPSRSVARLPDPTVSFVVVEQMVQPFAARKAASATSKDNQAALNPVMATSGLFLAIWICGAVAILFRWLRGWKRLVAVTREAETISDGRAFHMLRRIEATMNGPVPLPILSSPRPIEPGVFGIIRPVLLLPSGISAKLSDDQLQAILTHELCHARRRDNLAAAIHMIVETLFWFHPLVWWLGSRLVDERERACDEEVLSLGGEPQAYAEGILAVCQLSVEPPPACAAGVTGSDLKKRLEAIMGNKVFESLTILKKSIIAMTSIAAVSLPFFVGFLDASRIQAKPQAVTSEGFEVASIKEHQDGAPPSFGRPDLPGGRYSVKGIPFQFLLSEAYGIGFQSRRLVIEKGPQVDDSVGAALWDIEAVAPKDAIPTDATAAVRRQILRHMLQKLLADRFQMVVRHDVKEQPVYAILVGKNGPKLQKSSMDEKDCADKSLSVGNSTLCHIIGGGIGQGLHGQAVTIADVASWVENWSDKPVVDKTELTGLYNIQTGGWAPQRPRPPRPAGTDPSPEELALADPSRATLADIFDGLGLKLDSQRALIDTVVVVAVKRPSEN